MGATTNQPAGGLAKFADIVLIGGGISCILTLFYSIYYYALSGRRSFTSPTGMVLYYGVPALLACILFAALRLETLKKTSLALLMLSIAVSIHAGNLFLGLVDVRSTSANRTLWFRPGDIQEILNLAKEYRVPFDSRTKLQVINDLKASGIDAVPSFVPLGFLTGQPDGTRRSEIRLNGVETLLHGGISNRTTVYCNEEGNYVIYESDEHGFHNPRGIWGGSVDIVALGDSFTQGSCVPSEKNFVSVIRGRYPKTLNLAMAGQGPLNMLATLKDYVRPLEPKVVLWFFYEGNDVSDLLYERHSPLLMQYLDGNFSQALTGRQAEIDRALETYIRTETSRRIYPKPKTWFDTLNRSRELLAKFAKLSPLRQRLGLVYGNFSPLSLPDPDDQMTMDLLDRTLREAKATVDRWNGKLYFVYLPERDSCFDSGRTVVDHAEILAMVETIGLPVIDIYQAFRSQSDPLTLFPFRRLGHYNQNGHRLVGEEVLKSVSANGTGDFMDRLRP
jgi:hypothetical protein